MMIKILLVDDNAIVRKAIKNMLKSQLKIQVIGECSDGSHVIPYLQNNKPDVILMDYRMPVLDGVETTKLVKELFPKIKVIGFSCDDDIITKETFFENGAYSFLSKYDTNLDELLTEIKKCYNDT
jgi:DNA-binding NarL/FixJ family response regulator